MVVDPLLARLLPPFVAEAEQLVQLVTVSLLAQERGFDRARAEEALRALHTLKGTAATLGLEDVSELAHDLEEVLGRAGEVAVAAAVLDDVLGALDAVMAHVRAAAAGSERPPALAEARRRVAALLASTPAASTAPAAATPVPDEAPGGAAAVAEDAWRVRAGDVETLAREVERLRELRLRLDARRAALERALGALDAPSAGPSALGDDLRLALSTVRRGLAADGEEAASLVADFEGAVRAISTLPARTALESLPRAVRDLARKRDKAARLSVVGDDVALDRRLLGPLSMALVHLVRNAVDHGIEAPAVREARGKDPEGLITVRIERQGNSVHVEVVDDGGGIDLAAVRAAAARHGVGAPEALAALSDAEVRQLVFAPRLSTRAEADETSGRGVGLDVVREQVLSLRGQVGVESRLGQGTTFQLTLPIELGATPVLVVGVGEHRLGLPLGVVELVGRPREADLRGGARPALAIGDELVDVHDLGGLLGVRRPLPARAGRQHVLVRGQGRRAAVIVDHIVGHDDLVVRPLPDELGPMAAYTGVATLAHGELLPVLRPSWLLERVVPVASGAPDEPGASGPRALVVDDVLTARAIHRASLESAGWVVYVASNVRQALERLAEGRLDALVTDLRLADEDGLDLLRRARALAPDLPVVVVSGMDDEETRRAAVVAGADAFVAKRDCAQGALAAEVAAAVARRRSLAGR